MTDFPSKNKSIFPAITPNTPYEIWKGLVMAVKVTDSKYTGLDEGKKDEYEAYQLMLAAAHYRPVSDLLNSTVYREKLANKLTDKEWVAKSYETIEAILKPLDKDRRRTVVQQLESLPFTAHKEFGTDVVKLVNHFTLLKADAAAYGAYYQDERLAEILIQAAPQQIRIQLLLNLKDDQTDPDKVTHALRSLAAATGAQLPSVLNAHFSQEQSDEAYYLDRTQRGTTRGPPPRTQRPRNSNGPCKRCGYAKGHANPEECRANGQDCKKCGKKNHFAKVCRSKEAHYTETPATDSSDSPTEWCSAVTANTEVTYMTATTPPHGATVAATRYHLDTCCTHHVVPEMAARGYIESEEPSHVVYYTAQKESFIAHKRAILRLPLQLATSEVKIVRLRVNIGPNHLPCLLKPKYLHLAERAEESWAVLEDADGHEVKVTVDSPHGGERRMPYILLKNTTAPQKCWATIRQDELQGHHARLLDPCPQRLLGTLQEQGINVSIGSIKQAVKGCRVCARKNSVHHTPPRSTTRRHEGKSFNQEVFVDTAAIHESGIRQEKVVILFVDTATAWWEARAATKKSAAAGLLLEWIAMHGPPQALRSDNAKELKEGQVKEICAKHNILLPPSPPYSSATQGIVERAIREFRALLRTILNRLRLDYKWWPALVRGIALVHNVTHSEAIGSSPAYAKTNEAPTLAFLPGDSAVIKLPADKTAPKTLDLPGEEVLYFGPLNAHTAVVYKDGRLFNVHPVNLKPARTGQLAVWQRRWTAANAPPPSPPTRDDQETVVNLGNPHSYYDTDSSSDEEVQLMRRRTDLTAAPQEPPEEPQPSSPPPAASGGTPPISRGPPTVEGPPPDTPTGRPLGVLLPYDNGRGVKLLHAARVIKTAKNGAISIAWLQQQSDGRWEPQALGEARWPEVVRFFKITDERLPDDVVEQVGKEKPEEAHYTITVPRFTGGSSQKPAKQEDLDNGIYEPAKIKEFVTVLRNGVLGPIAQGPVKHCMGLGWRMSEKENNETGERTYKARMFCKGFMDQTRHETFAGTPDLFMILVSFIYALSAGFKMCISDVRAAFLQAGFGTCRAVVRIGRSLPTLPIECPLSDMTKKEWDHVRAFAATLRPGQFRVLKKALYGDRRAPYMWNMMLRTILTDLGYSEIEESIAVTRAAKEIIINHVDDLLFAAIEPEVEHKKVNKEVAMTPPTQIKEGEVVKFVGLELLKVGAELRISQTSYLNNFPPKKGGGAVREQDLADATPEETDFNLAPEYQTLIGRLGWAVKTRPDQYVYYAELSRHVTKPAQRHLQAAERILQAMRERPTELTYHPVKDTPVLVAYSDAAFKRVAKTSRTGFKVYIADNVDYQHKETNLVGWATRRVKVMIDSSTGAELLGLKHLVKQLPKYSNMVEALWGRKPGVQIYIDSKPLFDIIRKGRFSEDPALQVELDFVLERMRKMECEVEWVRREYQRADVMTKCVWF
eukprot:GHVU01232569.1.p1 GENE.GHVU01232569.1~~GHVU01232569.1.p1  ORF type:complete len:1463 (-),score=213.14 GHVU01232569.1:53-4441(-)